MYDVNKWSPEKHIALQCHNNIDLTAQNSKPQKSFHLSPKYKSFLRNKIVDLRHILFETGLEIVAISETKLCSEFPDSQFKIEGYSFPPHRKDRTKHGGGLLVFTNRQKDLESDLLEIICLELVISKRKWIIFSVYRPPKQNLSTFFSELYKCLDKATRKY